MAGGWGRGLLVTARDRVAERRGLGVTLTLENGGWQDWTLWRGAGRLALLAGDREVWSAPDPGPFRSVRPGETRTDDEHGGTLRLNTLQFTRYVT